MDRINHAEGKKNTSKGPDQPYQNASEPMSVIHTPKTLDKNSLK